MAANFNNFRALSDALFAFHFDRLESTGFGSVWRVSEETWKKSYVGYHSDADMHPAVSVRRGPAADLSYVPMLHGRTKKSCVLARGLSRERGPFWPTWFGHLWRPAKIQKNWFTADSDDPNLLNWHARVRVVVNHHKPRLTADEEHELWTWWDRWCRENREVEDA